jgi:acetate kinase
VSVLLLNAGSSSLKGVLIRGEDRRVLARASADWAGPVTRYQCSGPGIEIGPTEVAWRGHAEALRQAVGDLEPARAGLEQASSLTAVGHRIVFGGEFTSAVRLGPAVRSRIAELAELAPLHNPPGLDTLAAAESELPEVPQVAVFDTAFHATLPPAAYTFPVPGSWTRDWKIRRFGFHGLSHAYCSGRAAAMLGRPLEELRLVICHLGSGCSASAVLGGRCVDTTMGFTPLDGLMMATRSGSVDPGILLYVQRCRGLSAREVEEALHRESGLFGVSGISGDMRIVLAAARAGNEQAQLAFDVYTHRARQAIGGLTATLGGIDALVFTAGVGENSAEVRAASCQGLGCLGLELDADANAACRADADIARQDSRGRILVMRTREELAMLDDVMRVIRS